MIWKVKHVEAKYKDNGRYWRPFFCLKPREIEGYKVWLEYIEREELYTDLTVGGSHFWYRKETWRFRLTEKQKIRIGKKW